MKKSEILLTKPNKNSNSKIGWFREGNIIVITYPKNFGSIEKWFHDRIGGPELVKRPLDKYTTLIWELCDGENSVMDIIKKPSDAQAEKAEAQLGCDIKAFYECNVENTMSIWELGIKGFCNKKVEV